MWALELQRGPLIYPILQNALKGAIVRDDETTLRWFQSVPSGGQVRRKDTCSTSWSGFRLQGLGFTV